jgi:hypothetical protein
MWNGNGRQQLQVALFARCLCVWRGEGTSVGIFGRECKVELQEEAQGWEGWDDLLAFPHAVVN